MQRQGFHHNRGRTIVSGNSRGIPERIKNFIILILIVCLAASLVLGIPAIKAQRDYQHDVVARMQTECGDAQYILAHLSNTGSSSTYAQLARIRSGIYAIDVLNQSYSALPGAKDLVAKQLLTDIYTQVDNYYAALIASATNTSILLKDLGSTLDNLQAALGAIG